jgi:hypothetical protein
MKNKEVNKVKLAHKVKLCLGESFKIEQRLRMIRYEVDKKNTSRTELLSHLTSLEFLLRDNPRLKNSITALIRKTELKLKKL